MLFYEAYNLLINEGYNGDYIIGSNDKNEKCIFLQKKGKEVCYLSNHSYIPINSFGDISDNFYIPFNNFGNINKYKYQYIKNESLNFIEAMELVYNKNLMVTRKGNNEIILSKNNDFTNDIIICNIKKTSLGKNAHIYIPNKEDILSEDWVIYNRE